MDGRDKPGHDHADGVVLTRGVMRGLDPRIHDVSQRERTLQALLVLKVIMDGRDKPGHDRTVVTKPAPGMAGHSLPPHVMAGLVPAIHVFTVCAGCPAQRRARARRPFGRA